MDFSCYYIFLLGFFIYRKYQTCFFPCGGNVPQRSWSSTTPFPRPTSHPNLHTTPLPESVPPSPFFTFFPMFPLRFPPCSLPVFSQCSLHVLSPCSLHGFPAFPPRINNKLFYFKGNIPKHILYSW